MNSGRASPHQINPDGLNELSAISFAFESARVLAARGNSMDALITLNAAIQKGERGNLQGEI
jgi:hypothetical protein